MSDTEQNLEKEEKEVVVKDEHKCSKKINIICLNMCLMPFGLSNAGSGNDMIADRLELFFLFYASKADVLLLSEVWDSFCSNPESVSSNLYRTIEVAKRYGFIHNYYNERKWYQICNNGLIIFSRYPIKDNGNITFSSSSGFQWVVPNGSIFCEIHFEKENGDIVPVSFFTTHVHAGSLDTSCCNSVSTTKSIQKSQITELKDFINKISVGKNNKIKWICSGDFNVDSNDTYSGQYTLEYQCLKSIMGESMLSDKGFPTTYPVPEEGSFLVNKKFIGEKTCVDHCFSSFEGGIEVDVKCLEVEKIPISDHAAIYIEINI